MSYRSGYRYNCGGFSNYSGPCGASDCGSCRNGAPPWEDEEEPEEEVVSSRSFRVVRKTRTGRCSVLGGTAEYRVGDLVRVESGFSFIPEGGPRTGYFRSESRCGLGPSHGPNHVAKGEWARSKRGAYEAYHGTKPAVVLEREAILSRASRMTSYPTADGPPTREDFAAVLEAAAAFFKAHGEEIEWNRYSTPERIEASFVAREERAALEEERSVMRRAREGDVVSWKGSEVRRGATFSKVIMHSNFEYAGGAGDCSVETRVTLTPTDGSPSFIVRY